jgi:hypothetical protein
MDDLVDSSEITMLARDLDATHLWQLNAAKMLQVELGVSIRHQVAEQLQTILVKLELLSGQLERSCAQDAGGSDLQQEAARQVEQVTRRIGLMVVDLKLAITKQQQIACQVKLGIAKQLQTDAAHQVHRIGLMLEELATDLGQANELLYLVEQVDQGNEVGREATR